LSNSAAAAAVGMPFFSFALESDFFVLALFFDFFYILPKPLLFCCQRHL
jgi:hypothetical protein